MKTKSQLLLLILVVVLGGCSKPSLESVVLDVNRDGLKILPPTTGVYHGLYPDFPAGVERSIWTEKIQQSEQTLRKTFALVAYQNDFVDGLLFPSEAVLDIVAEGKTPLIRMMPRSRRAQEYGEDPIYKMQSFLDGQFDEALTEWARKAKAVQSPLMVEFGPEVNGQWYSWNGKWNGGSETVGYGDPMLPDGPERFRDVYRHIVDIFRKEEVKNITWVFHVDSQPKPDEPWNRMANYYPGDAYIDWIGVSVFGAQLPGDWWGSFTEILDEKWEELDALSYNRPIAVLEWGVIERPDHPYAKAQWIENALRAVLSGRYPRVRAINYWHESSWNGANAKNFRIDTTPQALSAYNRMITDPRFLTRVETTQSLVSR